MAWETAPSTVAGDVALGALGADTGTKSDACRLHDPPPILGTRLTVGMRQKVGGEHRVDDKGVSKGSKRSIGCGSADVCSTGGGGVGDVEDAMPGGMLTLEPGSNGLCVRGDEGGGGGGGSAADGGGGSCGSSVASSNGVSNGGAGGGSRGCGVGSSGGIGGSSGGGAAWAVRAVAPVRLARAERTDATADLRSVGFGDGDTGTLGDKGAEVASSR
jgi:hypothetical protein